MKFLSVMNVSLKVIARKDYTFIKRRNMKTNSTVMYVIELLTVFLVWAGTANKVEYIFFKTEHTY